VSLPFVARLWLVVAIAVGALVFAPATALAHATLVRAEPAVNGRLNACPTRVRLEFNEAIEPTMAAASVLDMHGSRVVLSLSGDPHDVHAVIASVACLGNGPYRLSWRVVSADGHPVGGSYGFAIEDGIAAAALPMTPRDSAMLAHESAMMVHESEMIAHEPEVWGISVAGAPLGLAMLRGLALGALLSLSGVLFFRSGAQGGEMGTVDIVTRGLAVLTPLLLAAHFAVWMVNADAVHRFTSESLSVATNTGMGQRELLRIGFALLALWALVLARRARLALAFSAGSLLVSSAIGHTAAIVPEWAIPGKALHLLASAAWIGGVLWLMLLDHTDVSRFARETARVSRVALICVIVVAFSGLVQSWLFLSSPSDLVHSPYGLLVLAKIIGTLVLIGFGADHRKRTLPRGEEVWSPERLAATLRGELAVMAVVVLIGGLLAYVPPPHAMPEMNSPTTEP
jgi:copper transport protein